MNRTAPLLAAALGLLAATPAAAQSGLPPGGLFQAFPNAYIGASAVFLSRITSGPNRILVVDENADGNPNDDTPLLRIRDMDVSGFKPGFEIKGGLRVADHWWLAAEFLWISQAKASRAADGSPNDTGFPGGATSARTNFDDGDRFSGRLRSDMLTFRIAGQYQVRPWLTLVGGIRYLQIVDQLDVAIFTANHDFNMEARNHLIGGEIGAVAKYEILRGLTASLGGTIGAFANITSVNRRFADSDAAGIGVFTNRQTKTGFSFVGEARASLEYQLHEMISIFAGYRMLYVSGVATAAHNGDTTIAASGFPASLGVSRGGVLYHGAMGGLKIRW